MMAMVFSILLAATEYSLDTELSPDNRGGTASTNANPALARDINLSAVQQPNIIRCQHRCVSSVVELPIYEVAKNLGAILVALKQFEFFACRTTLELLDPRDDLLPLARTVVGIKRGTTTLDVAILVDLAKGLVTKAVLKAQ